MHEYELEITSEQIQKLSDKSVGFYLALGKNAQQVAAIYRVPLSRVEKIVARLNKEREREESRAQARLRQALGGRPCPPEALLDMPGLFAPAPGLLDWARETFISGGSPLYNSDHDHLAYASVAFLWTSAPYKKYGRAVAGLCEMPTVAGKRLGAGADGQSALRLVRKGAEVPDYAVCPDSSRFGRRQLLRSGGA